MKNAFQRARRKHHDPHRWLFASRCDARLIRNWLCRRGTPTLPLRLGARASRSRRTFGRRPLSVAARSPHIRKHLWRLCVRTSALGFRGRRSNDDSAPPNHARRRSASSHRPFVSRRSVGRGGVISASAESVFRNRLVGRNTHGSWEKQAPLRSSKIRERARFDVRRSIVERARLLADTVLVRVT